ncbi:MAG: hypothetical protein ABIH76_03470 [Candidatus Bathyarchaeota archaeon]
MSNIDYAIQCSAEFQKSLHNGLAFLMNDLEEAQPYDHDNPQAYGKYEDKNSYMKNANSFGRPFMQIIGFTGLSKMYYWHLLNKINSFEKEKNKPLNKGIVCGNLGVSDLAEGDIDGGIAHLLWAGYEDRGWAKEYTQNILSSSLYTQFAEGKQRGGLNQFGGESSWTLLKKAIDAFNRATNEKMEIKSIFNELHDKDEHRAILEGSLRYFCKFLEQPGRPICLRGER